MNIPPELLDRVQLMYILGSVEDLVELRQIGDDIFDGDMTAYTLAEVVDSMLVFGLVRFMGALLVLRLFSLGVRMNMLVVVVLLHDVTNLRYSAGMSILKVQSYHPIQFLIKSCIQFLLRIHEKKCGNAITPC